MKWNKITQLRRGITECVDSMGNHATGKGTAKMSAKAKNPDKIGIGKFWAWNSRAISVTCNVLIMGYMSIYCTDTLMIKPAIVGAMLVISRLSDGFTDLIAGYLVDRTETRLGKARPYELAIIGVWLCTLLMYSCPEGLGTFAKAAWVLVMYIFVQSVFNTLLGANDLVYMVRAFGNDKIYAKLNSYGGIIACIAGMFVNISFPILMANLAVSAAGWRTLIAIYAIPLMFIGLLRFIFVKEEYNTDVVRESGEKTNLKDVLYLLKNNKYIYIVALVVMLNSFAASMGVSTYYYKYIIGNLSLAGAAAVITMVGIPLLFFFPALVKKLTAVGLIRLGGIVSIVGYSICFIANDNFIVYAIGNLVFGVGMLPFSYMISLLTIECASYNEWKKCPRMEGVLNSIISFGKKTGSALGAAITGLLLGFVGYDASLSVMPDSVLMMIRILAGVIPAGLYLIAVIVLHFYKLNKMMPQIQADNEAARAQALQKAAGAEGTDHE